MSSYVLSKMHSCSHQNMEEHKRLRSIHLNKGLGLHLGNEITANAPTLIPIKSSISVLNTNECLEPNLAIPTQAYTQTIYVRNDEYKL